MWDEEETTFAGTPLYLWEEERNRPHGEVQLWIDEDGQEWLIDEDGREIPY